MEGKKSPKLRAWPKTAKYGGKGEDEGGVSVRGYGRATRGRTNMMGGGIFCEWKKNHHLLPVIKNQHTHIRKFIKSVRTLG